MFVFAGTSFIVFFTGLIAHFLVLGIGALALSLAITNFGRQCPLLLSLRYQINRMKSHKPDNHIH
jgi:hypothetical protein